jgi:Fe-S-cluster-containing hydrogenase component 2
VLCPEDAVTFDSGKNAYTTCDCCDGDPLCVSICPTGALSYAEPSKISCDFREAYSRNHFHKLMEEGEQ